MSAPLIKINMLPYREQQDLEKQAKFKRMMLIAFGIGLAAAAFTYVSLQGMVLAQEARNEQLKQGIAALEEQIKEVQSLRDEKATFLARKRKVEELENKRFEAARMIDSLNAMAPDGVYLTSIKSRSANEYTLTGKATSDSKIADFMRVIPETQMFEQPTLARINKVENLQEFELNVKVQPRQAEASASASAPAPAAASGTTNQ